MLHSNTQGLIDHWRALRFGADSPARRSLEPADIAEILPQVFIVGRGTPALGFRLAGGFLSDLHGPGLRGASLLELWGPQSRAAVREAAVAAVREREPVVLYADARAAGGFLGLELLLAPMTGPGGRLDRMLGLYQPLTSLSVLRGEPIGPLSHRFTLRLPRDEAQRSPPIRLAAVNGARV